MYTTNNKRSVLMYTGVVISLVMSAFLFGGAQAEDQPQEGDTLNTVYLPLIVGADVSSTSSAQEPDIDATPTPEEVGTESPELTTSIFLPVIANGQEGGGSGQSQQETESVAALVLGEEPQVETSVKSADAQDDLSEGQVPPEPGLETPVLESADVKVNVPEEEAVVAPAAIDGWTTIMSEGFEGVFPKTGWRVLDNDGSTNGEYYWDDTNYTSYSGSWSAWAAKGGANGLDPRLYNYPNNMRSWMIYGPFDLSNATDAKLTFNYWNRSELYYDYFYWLASVDGTYFYGYNTSGDSGGWRSVNFDLTAVPGLGNLTGRSSVWIAFYFGSDASVTNKGPFVDNVTLQKLVNTVSCPQYKAEYFNNRTLSGSPTVTRCENWPINYNWGTGSPVSGLGSDNFSVRWTGTPYIISEGLYTFLATTDDGIRVWLDNSLIIDAWQDHPPTTYQTNRMVSTGSHSVKVEYYENGGGAVAQFAWSPAIVYSTRNGFHVFRIDMSNPTLSFEMVMAQDSTNANQNPSPRETVSAMVTRPPYASRNPVLAFNADYFDPKGRWGPQGLTVKNGTRFPNAGSHNGDEWRRSSISISSSKGIRIGKQTDCVGTTSNPGACTNWAPDSNAYYNTAGGGPLFVDNASRIRRSGETNNSNLPCRNENLEDRYCIGSLAPNGSGFFKWTAVGVSQDRRYLIVIVSGSKKSMDEAAAVLIAEGAWQAMKLDAGSSTQVWYKGRDSLVTGNAVANAILVFATP